MCQRGGGNDERGLVGAQHTKGLVGDGEQAFDVA